MRHRRRLPRTGPRHDLAAGLAFALNAGRAAVPSALGPRFAVVRIR